MEAREIGMREGVEAVGDLAAVRRRMLLDLEWYLSQRLERVREDQQELPRQVILVDGRAIEEKLW